MCLTRDYNYLSDYWKNYKTSKNKSLLSGSCSLVEERGAHNAVGRGSIPLGTTKFL